jgi:hypothetical protein
VTLSQGKLAESLSVRAFSDDGSLRDDNALTRFGDLMTDALIATDRAAPSEELLRERLEKAGFVDVQSFTLRLPVGPWAKDKYEPWTARHCENGKYSLQYLNRTLKKVGVMALLSCETGFHAYGTYLRWRMPARLW